MKVQIFFTDDGDDQNAHVQTIIDKFYNPKAGLVSSGLQQYVDEINNQIVQIASNAANKDGVLNPDHGQYISYIEDVTMRKIKTTKVGPAKIMDETTHPRSSGTGRIALKKKANSK